MVHVARISGRYCCRGEVLVRRNAAPVKTISEALKQAVSLRAEIGPPDSVLAGLPGGPGREQLGVARGYIEYGRPFAEFQTTGAQDTGLYRPRIRSNGNGV
jgi:hypothetical protein